MAVGRLSERARASNAIWPGFVDAMTALLLVLMFVLSIFMMVQFVLRTTISGQETQIERQEQELSSLSAQLSQLSNVLAMEQARGDDLESDLGVARATLTERDAEISRLGALAAALGDDKTALESRVASFEAQVASLLAAQADLEANVASLEADKAAEIDAKEALQLALAQARDEIDAEQEAARLAAAQREAMEALIASLEVDKAEAAETIAGLQAENADADARIADLDAALSEEERLKLLEAAAAEALRERLQAADAELTALTLNLEAKRKEAEETLTLLAAAEAAKASLETAGAATATELERESALLALARRTLTERNEEISAQAKELALLNEQATELRAQLATLSAQLAASEALDEAQNVELANLGSRLNAALARELQLKAAEAARLAAERESLEAYRSEFFGEMRKALGDRRDIRIVGDRFVFQSEVLFSSGSAELDPAGRAELAELGGALREVIRDIPETLDWLLVVEGHTDDVAFFSTGKYGDNWELSQGRALSVVRFLSEQAGVPSERLAALGYGEYQPIDPGASEDARARNRRIELKFTERPTRTAPN